MRLLLIRHAKAEKRDWFGLTKKRDAERPLTPSGRKEMRKAAKTLKRLVPDIALLATSPFARARQTAEAVASVYALPDVVEVPALKPGGSNQTLLDWLRLQSVEATVALVGHEPDMGQLAGWLLTGENGEFLTLKKGAACLVDFSTKPVPGEGKLLWLLAPSQLRKIGI